ncbi:MAG: hypothetical protein U0324_10385 [Polyangiales bacterium]
MSDDLPPLPPEARALFDAAREAPPPPDAARAAVYERVLRTVAAPGPGNPPAAAAPASSLAVKSVAAVGAALAVAAGVTVALWSGTRVPAPRTVPAAAPRVAPASPAPPVAPAAPREALHDTDASAAPADAASPRPHARAPEDDLAAEVALVDEARATLARGDAAGAQRVVRRYRHLSHRRLDAEMDVLEVRAAVLGHDPAGAGRLAERFHRRHPGSVLAAQVDDAVRGAR